MHRAEVRVDRAQLVWLTLGAVVSLGLAFALGFVVGRRAQRIEPVPSSVDVITQIESDKQVHAELTFYRTLTETKKKHTKPRTKAAQEEGRALIVAPKPAIVVAKARPVPAVRAVLPARSSTPPQAKPPPPRSLENAVARARQTAAHVDVDNSELRAALAAGPTIPGDYTVQVSAFQSLGEAKAFSAGLERKGFKPFVVTSALNGRGTWYRVRMGRFTDEETAKRAKTLLAQADIPAWVLRTE